MPPLSAEQRRVLLATARVAGIAALVACGPKQAAAPQAPAETAAAEAPSTVAPDEGPAPSDEQAMADQTAPELSIETCLPVTAEALAGFGFGKKPASVSDEVVACCDLLLGSNIQDLGRFEGRWGCCAVVEEPQPMACTPWGPPAPPVMRYAGSTAA